MIICIIFTTITTTPITTPIIPSNTTIIPTTSVTTTNTIILINNMTNIKTNIIYIYQQSLAPTTIAIEDGQTGASELVPFYACCCFMSSCVCEYPECVGAVAEGSVCCFEGNLKACRISSVADKWCICLEADVYLQSPKTCIKCVEQICCIDARCSFPCDKEEVPCLVTIFFITCCYDWSFIGCAACKKVNQIEAMKNGKQITGLPRC